MFVETQIVVVGGGGAGLSAAAAAAELGINVVIVEKRNIPGGNSAMAEGLFAVESPAQNRMKITAGRDEAFKIAMAYAHWRLDARIIRAFVDKSGDTIDWLEKKGMYFDWIPPYYPDQPIRTWHCVKGRGVVLTRLLTEYCNERGVRFLYGHKAQRLLTDCRGALVGVTALSEHGDEVEIRARCAIVCTGGYGGNGELLRKHCPDYGVHFVYRGIANQGDGLRMTTEIGAATEGLGILQLSGHTCPALSLPAAAICEEPNSVWVNREGVRFIDEGTAFNHFESVNGVVRQPGSLCYVLLDQRIVENMARNGIVKGAGQIVPPGTKLPGLEGDLGQVSEKSPEWIRIADSWDEVEEWMGIRFGTLRTTVDEYNAFCRDGHDRLFVKDPAYLIALLTPPFYAVKCCPAFLGTIGGIKINHRMEILDHEHQPIPGLFACGSETGGWEADTYNVVLSGSTFGFAINSGRIAGENAAQYVSASRVFPSPSAS
jgi:fumarate reductase flavoprotein subunit